LTTVATTAPAHTIVLLARVGSERVTLTAAQVRDIVASYLARGERMPTPTDTNGEDPSGPLHVIVEEWLWGNVQGWVLGTDIVHLTKYRHQAMLWIRSYFGPTFPDLEA
ncbi:MAG: hypothetical protein ACRDQX_13850, partial [Pseudonocardiaceae bacterium]